MYNLGQNSLDIRLQNVEKSTTRIRLKYYFYKIREVLGSFAVDQPLFTAFNLSIDNLQTLTLGKFC